MLFSKFRIVSGSLVGCNTSVFCVCIGSTPVLIAKILNVTEIILRYFGLLYTEI